MFASLESDHNRSIEFAGASLDQELNRSIEISNRQLLNTSMMSGRENTRYASEL